MARPQDPAVTEALLVATRELLAERGVSAVSVTEIAKRAGVGKPAVYRRYPGKTELVVAAIRSALPNLAPPQGRTPRQRFRRLMDEAFPADPEAYLGLIGGLMAERRRHPELIEAFREQILLPRREVGRKAIAEGQRAGELRSDLEPEDAVDMLAGPLLARTFAGRDVGPAWRDRAFANWWSVVRAR
jgi:AcrR family transcriptional regulator